jgi:hypothetical protein
VGGGWGRGGRAGAVGCVRDYCFAMKSLSLGIVRTGGGCAGAARGLCGRGLGLLLRRWVDGAGARARGLALGIEPTSFFVVGGERSACCC